jgi:hypothetical protein
MKIFSPELNSAGFTAALNCGLCDKVIHADFFPPKLALCIISTQTLTRKTAQELVHIPTHGLF